MMDSKSLLRWPLLAVVFGSVTFYALRRPETPPAEADRSAAAVTDVTKASVVVTYFTTDVRCDSCRKIEELSRQAVEEGFAEEVARGQVAFRVLNTDRPENQHYVDAYELTNKTVVVSHRAGGREAEWTDRQDVWLLLDDPAEFLSYVREPVKRYLAKG